MQHEHDAGKRGPGRPSSFTPALAETICGRIADGDSLRAICADSGMPDWRTVLRWLDAMPDFASKYARAREAQADVMDELILATARSCTPETANADRVRIMAFQWRAARLAPKRYGEAHRHEISGAGGGPVSVAATGARERLLQKLGLLDGDEPRSQSR